MQAHQVGAADAHVTALLLVQRRCTAGVGGAPIRAAEAKPLVAGVCVLRLEPRATGARRGSTRAVSGRAGVCGLRGERVQTPPPERAGAAIYAVVGLRRSGCALKSVERANLLLGGLTEEGFLSLPVNGVAWTVGNT